ncbi:hypothetical protein VF21_05430 [Pseudogymnoascus sp. 05NY08]|nr:hypothetical protein VF21_05430 [Pseudogymnoascus sp. 05NY08]
MKTPHSPDSPEPYFQPDTGGSGTWHEISQLPLTEPKISSVMVSVNELNLWLERWLEQHQGHTPRSEYVTYGDLSDDERSYPKKMKEDGSDTEYLVRCCDEDRPPSWEKAPTLVVKPSADNGFVTVNDYISAVHPWLMSMREDIMTAMRVVLYYPPSLPTELMVTSVLAGVMITEKKRWIQRMRGSSYVRTVPIG